MRNHHGRPRSRAPALLALAASAPLAQAMDFSWAPFAKAETRMYDNVRGVSDRNVRQNAEAAWGFDTGGGVNLKAQSETLTSELLPRFNFRRFVIGDNLDADEYQVAFNNDWLQERYALGLDVSYIRDSTLTNEFDETGAFRVDVTNRDSVLLNPTAIWFMNDRTAVNGGFFYNDVSYVDAEGTGFVDYEYKQGTAGINHRWRDNATVFGNFYLSEFQAADDGNRLNGNQESKTRSYSGMAGMTWQWDPTLETTGAVGWIASDLEFFDTALALVLTPAPAIVVLSTPAEASASGPLAQVNIRKTFDTLVARFDYSRQVSPSGRGSQSRADRLALNVEKRLSPQFSLVFVGTYDIRSTEAENIGAGAGTAAVLNRDYAELLGSVRYRINQEWSVSATYRHGYRQSTNLNFSQSAHTNVFLLAVNFNGLPNPFNPGF